MADVAEALGIWGPAAELGESPLWDAQAQVLYYCDIAACRLHQLDPVTGAQAHWDFPCELACCALTASGALLLAMRDGLWRWHPQQGGERECVVPAPYDVRHERFNDGKCDPAGRFWVGTVYEPRHPPHAALYRLQVNPGAQAYGLERVAGDVTVSNGLAWSPCANHMYWADTTSHTIYRMNFDVHRGHAGERQAWVRFPRREPGQSLHDYGGRPDGAAVDQAGCYWVAMYEGRRLLRLSPSGECLQTVHLPMQCPTMPCFGAADGRTLFVTSARRGRPAQELAEQPAAGCVVALRVEVPGLPVPRVQGL